jgi:hypothetical protein
VRREALQFEHSTLDSGITALAQRSGYNCLNRSMVVVNARLSFAHRISPAPPSEYSCRKPLVLWEKRKSSSSSPPYKPSSAAIPSTPPIPSIPPFPPFPPPLPLCPPYLQRHTRYTLLQLNAVNLFSPMSLPKILPVFPPPSSPSRTRNDQISYWKNKPGTNHRKTFRTNHHAHRGIVAKHIDQTKQQRKAVRTTFCSLYMHLQPPRLGNKISHKTAPMASTPTSKGRKNRGSNGGLKRPSRIPLWCSGVVMLSRWRNPN